MIKIKKCIIPEDIYNIKLLNSASISPNGTQIAYSVTSVREVQQDYYSSVYVSQLSLLEHVSSYLEIENARNPLWSPKQNSVCYISNQTGTPQLYILDVKNGEKTKLTTMKYGAFDPQFSPDGENIYYLSKSFEGESEKELTKELSAEEKSQIDLEDSNKVIHVKDLLYRVEGAGYLTGKKTHVWKVNIKTGEQKRLTQGNQDFKDHSVSPDGKYLTFVSSPESNEECKPLHCILWLYDVEMQEATVVKDDYFYIETPMVLSGGKEILFIGHDAKYGWATVRRIYLYRVIDKELIDLTRDFPFATSDTAISDLRGVELSNRVIINEQKRCCYFICNDNGDTKLWECNFERGIKLVADGKRQIYSVSADNVRKRFLLLYTTCDIPCDMALLDIETGVENCISSINEKILEQRYISKPEEFKFECDGISHKGWIMKPPLFDKNKKYPSILEIHGGPQMMYANNFMFEFQYLTSMGYVVYYSNPRGSSGFGQEFMNAIRRKNGGLGGSDYRDIMASADYVEQLEFIDKNRMYVTGGSYGGFMTNWIVGHTERFRAAVTQRSISNIRSYILNSDYGYCKPDIEYDFDYFTEVEEADRISPITYVDNMVTPLLILHSERDYRCPLEQAIQLFIELKLRKREVEMRIFPNSNHSLSREGIPRLRIERLKSIAMWFERHKD